MRNGIHNQNEFNFQNNQNQFANSNKNVQQQMNGNDATFG